MALGRVKHAIEAKVASHRPYSCPGDTQASKEAATPLPPHSLLVYFFSLRVDYLFCLVSVGVPGVWWVWRAWGGRGGVVAVVCVVVGR